MGPGGESWMVETWHLPTPGREGDTGWEHMEHPAELIFFLKITKFS